MSLIKSAFVSLSMLAIVACGSTDSGSSPTSDAGTDAPADHYVAPTPDSGGQDAGKDGGPFAPADHDAPPQVVSYGGNVMKHALIVPIFFPNDNLQAQIEDFLGQLAASSYWNATTSEYGVGPITIAPSVIINDTPPTTSNGIDKLIKQHVQAAKDAAAAGSTDGGTTGSDSGAAGSAGAAGAAGMAGAAGAAGMAGAAGTSGAGGTTGAGGTANDAGASDAGGPAPFPVPTPDTIYAIFIPDGVTITDNQVGQSCKSYGGYHTETNGFGGNTANSKIPYAVMPRCNHFNYFSGIDAATATLSHELIEAATDPHPYSDPAFASTDDQHAVWSIIPAAEIGDMCAYEPQSFARLVGGYVVQRVWSNASALAGHDPCVPVLTDPYFNAVPDQPDDVVLSYYGSSVNTRGVKIPVGQSRTIDVHLFSDAPTTSWFVQAQDAAAATGGPSTLSLSLDKSVGNNGDVLHLTITRNSAAPQGSASEFMLWSQDQKTQYANVWFGFVGD